MTSRHVCRYSQTTKEEVAQRRRIPIREQRGEDNIQPCAKLDLP
jgi:hypothetical protein